MEIWILNHYAIPRHLSGGTTHAVIAEHLQQAGHRVTVFPGSCQQAGKCACAIPRGRPFVDRVHGGVRFRYVPTRPYRGTVTRLLNMLSYARAFPRAQAGLPRPDAIIGSCVHPLAVEAARRSARSLGAAFIYQIRDIWPQSLVDMGAISRRHPLYWYFRRIECRAFREADGVTGVMPGIGRYAAENGVPEYRVACLPNGIDPALYPQDVPPPVDGRFILSYLGSHGRANGLATLLKAAAFLQRDPRGQRVSIRLVGDGPEKPRLRQQAAEQSLGNVAFYDVVPKHELARRAAESHAFVFLLTAFPALRQYGLSSNKLFDYLMAARPIAFAAESFNNPVAESGAGLTAPPEDPVALAEVILQLEGLPAEQRIRMGQNGRRWVLAHHDLAKIARRWEEFLVAIVGMPRRAAEKPRELKRAA